ncbi:MAG: ACT domain-containing protein [Firmicutes bacterium]|nr:ACT domain-containing protein [Bacillota bacterium]MBQ4504626.1 ACT domain-containing protein [Bacillota bacterium]MBQ4576477.1 ACT domain-containing protein [Bacillota bacterium]MBQ6949045.1 ACT domain-containing protein [Bacillota bacterium]
MTIKQISVFVQNEPGRLLEFTDVLNQAGINMTSLNLADVTDYGIVRVIVEDTDKAVAVLKENKYNVIVNELLCVEVPDAPGALHEILVKLADNGLNISYMYGFTKGGHASLVLKVNDLDKAIASLQ